MSENLEKYLHHLDRLNMSEDRKIEALRAVYYIMKGFADRAFRRDPAQQALGYSPYLPLEETDNAVESKDNITSPERRQT